MAGRKNSGVSRPPIYPKTIDEKQQTKSTDISNAARFVAKPAKSQTSTQIPGIFYFNGQQHAYHYPQGENSADYAFPEALYPYTSSTLCNNGPTRTGHQTILPQISTAKVSTALNTAPTPAALLNYNELEYFEQFLGNLTTVQAATLAQMTSQIAVEGIPMLPVVTNQQKIKEETQLHPQPGNTARSGSSDTDSSSMATLYAYNSAKQSKGILDADTKRAHHIASEHKRRGRIRSELLRLNDLVPDLAGNNKNSQSRILSGAADFLEGVVAENEQLKRELAILKEQVYRK